MSFLLDVSDPSIHFRARPCSKPMTLGSANDSSISTLLSSSSTSTSTSSPSTSNTATTVDASKKMILLGWPRKDTVSPPTSNNNNNNNNNSVFAAMSRMIRNASSNTIPTASAATSTSPNLSPAQSPSTLHVSDPLDKTFWTTSGASSSSSTRSGFSSTTHSPWMTPSVCDDDQMNKLVSFQL